MASDKQRKEHRKELANQTIDLLNLEETAEMIHRLHIHQAELEAVHKNISRVTRDLARLRSDYADLFDVTPIGLFVFGHDWIIDKVNSVGAGMLGIKKDDCIGKPFIAFLEPESIGAFLDLFHQLKASGKRQVARITIKRLGGPSFPAECDLSPATDDTGNITHFRVVLTDMEERARKAEELMKQHPKQ
jgi:PAS domain S-box-containing protein